jgi:hypothetical protein
MSDSIFAPKTFETMYDVRLANRQAGHHFFEGGTLGFFKSRIGTELYGGRYFITSEQFDSNAPRLYSVREVSPNGHINTVGKFQEYGSSASARTAIRRLLSPRVEGRSSSRRFPRT